jgi:hypothetical protein
MTNGNGYRDAFWKVIPILATVLIALVGLVWGITFAETSRRMNRIDDIIICQRESIARIEAKVDLLLQYNSPSTVAQSSGAKMN